jgi:hypothetical protein
VYLTYKKFYLQRDEQSISGCERPSSFSLAPHSQKHNIQLPGSPTCSCLSWIPLFSTSLRAFEWDSKASWHPVPKNPSYSDDVTMFSIGPWSLTEDAVLRATCLFCILSYQSLWPKWKKLEPWRSEMTMRSRTSSQTEVWLLFSPILNTSPFAFSYPGICSTHREENLLRRRNSIQIHLPSLS